MKKSKVFSLLLSSVLSFSSYADFSRSDFIDQLDSANCSQIPQQIYLDTDNQHYDFANTLSLSWISLVTQNERVISDEELEQQWRIKNIEIINSDDNNLRIMIADYQEYVNQTTTLVTFYREENTENNLTDSELINTDSSFSLGEATHLEFSQALETTWETLVDKVRARAEGNQKLLVFGEGLGAAFAQLSAPGFEQEDLYVDKVYLNNAPRVGSSAWINKANKLLEGRVHSLIYENNNELTSNNYWNPVTYIQDIDYLISGNMEQYFIQGDKGYFCSLISILENE